MLQQSWLRSWEACPTRWLAAAIVGCVFASVAVIARAADDDPDVKSRAEARRAIREGRHAEAESLIRAGVKSSAGNRRDAWRIVEADLRHSQERFAEAGLVAMRVVILRPKSREVAAALYWAGRAYEGLGRPAKAAQLYRECIAHKTCTDVLKQRAQKRISIIEKDKPDA